MDARFDIGHRLVSVFCALVLVGSAGFLIAGCGDDPEGTNGQNAANDQNGANDSNGSTEAALQLEGQLSDFDGEQGDIHPDFSHTSATDVPTVGFLEEDGSFSISIEEDALEDEEEEIFLDDSLGLRCDEEWADDIDDDARFSRLTHFRIFGIDRDEVSFITAMADGDCEPPFYNCGHNAETQFVTWVYSTHSVELSASCQDDSSGTAIEHEIDVQLDTGWNVVLQDERERYDQSTVSIDSLDEAFDRVDWYYNDQ